ncbi:MAG: mevalonate kinase, partial [Halobacteriota archaeon]
MEVSSAPAKTYLFGEHAVVYGEPAVLTAVDLRTRVEVEAAGDDAVDAVDSTYVEPALDAVRRETDYEGGFEVSVESDVPVGAGLGSSAAVTVATVDAAAREVAGGLSRERVAELSYEVELEVQGAASPADTYASAHGGVCYVGDGVRESLDDDLDASLYVAWDGGSASTAEMVSRVRRLVDDTRVGDRVVTSIGVVSREGRAAVEAGDVRKVGRLMDVNHGLLEALGVSTSRLSEL